MKNQSSSKLNAQLIIFISVLFVFALIILFRNKDAIDAETLLQIENSGINAEGSLKSWMTFQTALIAIALFPLSLIFHFIHIGKKKHSPHLKPKTVYTKRIKKDISSEEKLLSKYPNLTSHELKLCEMIILKMSSKEIANQLNITPASVNKARYRMRKKFKLQTGDQLESFLSNAVK